MLNVTPKPKPYSKSEIKEMKEAKEHFGELKPGQETCSYLSCWCRYPDETPATLRAFRILVSALASAILATVIIRLLIKW